MPSAESNFLIGTIGTDGTFPLFILRPVAGRNEAVDPQKIRVGTANKGAACCAPTSLSLFSQFRRKRRCPLRRDVGPITLALDVDPEGPMDPVDALGFIKVQVHGDLGGSRRSSSPTVGIPRLATDDGRRRRCS